MITSGQMLVTTTRQVLDGTSNQPYRLVIHNSGSNAVYLGNENVTKDNGFNLHANNTLTIELPPLTTLYAVTGSGTHEVTWLRIDQ
jgi:hypothetical protein